MSRREIFAKDKNLESVQAKARFSPAKPAVQDPWSYYGRRPRVCPRNILLARDILLWSDNTTLHIWNWATGFQQSSTCQWSVWWHIWSSWPWPCQRTTHHEQCSFPYQRGSSSRIIAAARGRIFVPSWQRAPIWASLYAHWRIWKEVGSSNRGTGRVSNERIVFEIIRLSFGIHSRNTVEFELKLGMPAP